YNCGFVSEGQDLNANAAIALFPEDSPEIAKAKLDAELYHRAALAIRFLLKHNLKALLIVPVHFSTVDRLRFMPALLEAGGQLPDTAKHLLVFELKDLPSDMSRFRLRDPVGYLRNRSRGMILQTGFAFGGFDLFKDLGFHGVSVDLR